MNDSKIGRPKKKIVIDDSKNKVFSNKKIINVTVVKIKNNLYYMNEINNLYDINTHICIGKLIENKIIYRNNELKEENYV